MGFGGVLVLVKVFVLGWCEPHHLQSKMMGLSRVFMVGEVLGFLLCGGFLFLFCFYGYFGFVILDLVEVVCDTELDEGAMRY